jgi:hypothetical protein
VALRIPFMDMRPRPHGGQLALHGGVINVPCSVAKIQAVLPRQLHELGNVMLELHKSAMSTRAYKKQAIRPARVVAALRYLVEQPLYRLHRVELLDDWQATVQQAITQGVPAAEMVDGGGQEADADAGEPEAAFSNHDTLLDPITIPPPLTGTTIRVAPGEGFHPDPVRWPHAKEEMFPSVHCGVALTPTAPVSDTMLNRFAVRESSRRAASAPYLFYCYIQNTMEDINQAARLKLYRAKLLHRHCTVRDVVNRDCRLLLVHEQVAFHDLANIRGSPAYQQDMRNDMLAMMEALQTPTWFTSFSANDCGWEPLQHAMQCLLRHRPGEFAAVTRATVAQLTGSARCANVRDDPVTCDNIASCKWKERCMF